MDRITFRERLTEASESAISWAGKHVINLLPLSYLYLLFPNKSYDENPLVGDEEIFPDESLPDRKYLGPLNLEQVVDYLWRKGKVPEWIDISVQACDKHHSYLQLLCCGRFTSSDKMLYHTRQGHAPFHVVSPNFPPAWESIEENGKFDLYWHGYNPVDDA